MTSNVLWYTARGTGMTLLLVLTLTVVLGITARSGRPAAGLPGFGVAAVHRSASLFALALLAVHVGALAADPYAQVTLIDAVLPFRAGYRPFWVGLGTVALDVLVALVVTSLLRRRIGARAWRGLHWSAYACWPLAFAHALGAGSDVGTGWQLLVAVACAGAVLLAVGWRCSASFPASGRAAVSPAAPTPAATRRAPAPVPQTGRGTPAHPTADRSTGAATRVRGVAGTEHAR